MRVPVVPAFASALVLVLAVAAPALAVNRPGPTVSADASTGSMHSVFSATKIGPSPTEVRGNFIADGSLTTLGALPVAPFRFEGPVTCLGVDDRHNAALFYPLSKATPIGQGLAGIFIFLQDNGPPGSATPDKIGFAPVPLTSTIACPVIPGAALLSITSGDIKITP